MDRDIKKALISKILTETILKIIYLSDVELKDRFSQISGKILSEIAKIIRNEDYDDFTVVEEIVCLLEDNAIDCGGRHDF